MRRKRSRLIAALTALLLLAGIAACKAPAPPAAEPPAEEPPAAELPKPDPIAEQLKGMTLEEKVYQLLIVPPQQMAEGVGGVIFFGEDIRTPAQIRETIANLQQQAKTPLFIAVDEEGGRVARLGNNPAMGTTSFPPMGEMEGPEQAREVGRTIGGDLMQFGFNLDFAPVADVNSNPKNPVIGNRAFSSDPRTAARMAAACVEGFRESGVLCTLKHFPGHGDTATDSHLGAATSNKTLEELQACEFLPFEAGIAAGADLVMMGHISLPNVTGSDTPASLSYTVTTEILRQQLGFQGLILTDSMSMKAITDRYSSAEAAVKALQAGADLILMPADPQAAAAGILEAVQKGEITEERINESVYRILAKKITAP